VRCKKLHVLGGVFDRPRSATDAGEAFAVVVAVRVDKVWLPVFKRNSAISSPTPGVHGDVSIAGATPHPRHLEVKAETMVPGIFIEMLKVVTTQEFPEEHLNFAKKGELILA